MATCYTFAYIGMINTLPHKRTSIFSFFRPKRYWNHLVWAWVSRSLKWSYRKRCSTLSPQPLLLKQQEETWLLGVSLLHQPSQLFCRIEDSITWATNRVGYKVIQNCTLGLNPQTEGRRKYVGTKESLVQLFSRTKSSLCIRQLLLIEKKYPHLEWCNKKRRKFSVCYISRYSFSTDWVHALSPKEIRKDLDTRVWYRFLTWLNLHCNEAMRVTLLSSVGLWIWVCDIFSKFYLHIL